MSARQHGNMSIILCQFNYCLQQLRHNREYDSVERFLQCQSMGQIIYIFRCTSKMEKFQHLKKNIKECILQRIVKLNCTKYHMKSFKETSGQIYGEEP